MNQIYNVYCDESCHLENDNQRVMILGAIWCALEKTQEVAKRIREIKKRHKLGDNFEIKWTKISPSKLDFYLDIIDYFFDTDDLHFRYLVASKKQLEHKKFNQTHDDWYYKMYFGMLKSIFDPDDKYRIYLDIKDTRSSQKVERLHKILCNNMYDFNRKIIERVQIIRSHEVEIMQLSDILIGAVSHFYRVFGESEAKEKIINRIKERSGYSLEQSTLYREKKFNIFIWEPNNKE